MDHKGRRFRRRVGLELQIERDFFAKRISDQGGQGPKEPIGRGIDGLLVFQWSRIAYARSPTPSLENSVRWRVNDKIHIDAI